ncbi:MAG: 50S ribosomal protein L24 [Candidatus Latescibacteria bacterium]|nr:50S ribosomal protein L24 [Candidatus Latescibacterota bacterium]NIM20815.1 50S ribosomal protein L24 [Candidatus Latescibacterota bacterium]NIM64381.1 50S ribosomal protein L24 [Candidatus Latescibacterota bacterium]NIO00532.1 50S ribosomal protein L24 [Candidatus Latescibacterota bacterium]NIO26935.1 50S ribosomal protein L24 [Candidatus Latescibacterota bacterium]
MNIIKNDTVKVVSGNHRGKIGRVLKVFPNSNRVIVEKVNLVKRHRRPRSATDKGGILEKEAPIHVSNVMLVCPKCSKPSRTGVSFLSDGTKVRVCKSCNETLAANE